MESRSRRAPRLPPRTCWISGPGTGPGPWVISRHDCRPWTSRDLSSETRRTHAKRSAHLNRSFSKYHDPSQWKGDRACSIYAQWLYMYLQLGHVHLMAVLQVWSTKGLQKQEANTMSMQLWRSISPLFWWFVWRKRAIDGAPGVLWLKSGGIMVLDARTYTNLVVEELDVLDGLMEHRCSIRLHAHREIRLSSCMFCVRSRKE